MRYLDPNWGFLLFIGVLLGLFGIRLIARRLFSDRIRYMFLMGLCIFGIILGLVLAVYPFFNRPIDSGGIGVVFLFPLGGALILSFTVLLLINFRSKRC